jgi:hypothetical protein
MISREDIESWLIRMELRHEEIGDGMWLVDASEGPGTVEGTGAAIVVIVTPPLVLLRTNLGPQPDEDSDKLHVYRRMLEANATDLVHGAYGLEGSEIIVSDALELVDLDFSEFRASLESLALAVSAHETQIGKS